MTEQHLNTLKELLASSKEVQNSAELDATILAASLANAPVARNVTSSWHAVFPLNSVATAAVSITICMGVLLAMSQIISSDRNTEPYALTPNVSSELIIEVAPNHYPEPPILDGTLDGTGSIVKPRLPPEFGGRTTQDQILAGIELPSAQALLEGKEFSFADERSLTESSLSGALADINQMLRSGALNEARDRYDRLRRSCSVCDLPTSLEALALATNNSTTRI